MTARPANLRHASQFYAMRGVVKLLRLLGFRAAGNIGAFLGALVYRPLGIRRVVVEKQVRSAFPALDEQGVERIALAAYQHLGRSSIEMAVLPGYSRDELLSFFIPPQGWELFERARAAGKGLIVVTGHIGNWEMGGAYVAAREVPIDVVARRMENPLFDAFLTKTREQIGMKVIYDADAVRTVPRSIRGNRVVALLADQGAAGLASTWVLFFGRLAKTARGAATLALRLGAPVVFAAAIRQPDGKYQFVVEEVPVTPTGNLDADVEQIVTDYTATLERWVRRYPDQYFWHHRRWKHQREGTPPELGDPLK
ncbi:MAG: hypothetical protein JWO05_630 [Gemmatimonadetes bacterium]|nr:hypothetical protein [Gemmatimonadota bacterium]